MIYWNYFEMLTVHFYNCFVTYTLGQIEQQYNKK